MPARVVSRHAASLSPSRLRRATATYDGRVNLLQWREAVAGSTVRSQSHPGVRGAAVGVTELGQPALNHVLGFDVWLLVLLLSDAATLAAAAATSQSFGHGAEAVEKEGRAYEGGRRPETSLGLVELAAWLRSGLGLLGSELPACQPAQLPALCPSWVALLLQQELAGRYCSLLCLRGRAELTEDFPAAVERLNATCDPAGEQAVIFILVNTSRHLHVSAAEATTIRRSVSVRGLLLPGAGPERPVLWLDRFGVEAEGLVEFQNLKIVGNGTEAPEPQGAADSVIRVTRGDCHIIDSLVCIDRNAAGYGVVAGPVPSPSVVLGSARARLLRSEVQHCSVGCMVYLGGQISLESETSVKHCALGISSCDANSVVTVARDAHVECERQHQEFGGGVVSFERRG